MIRKFIISTIALTSLSACTYDIDQSNNLSVVPPLPPSNLNISLENAEILNQEALNIAMLCSAHKFNLKNGDELTKSLTAIDKDNSLETPETPDLRVVASSSKSTVKCVMTSPISGKCHAKVAVAGDIIPRNGTAEPFNILKSSIKPTFACEGVSKSLREASAETLNEIIDTVLTHNK